MYKQGGFNSFRTTLGEIFAGIVFTAAVLVVVGGTTLMCLERSVLFA